MSNLYLKALQTIIFIVILIPFLQITADLASAFKSGAPLFDGPAVHQQITADGLSFLKTNVVNLISGSEGVAHPDLSDDIANANFHFDSCNFKGTTENINDLYDRVVEDLNPASGTDLTDAAKKFGFLLHSVQDLYAHSNWVELQNTGSAHGFIDSGLGKWDVLLHPYNRVNGEVIIIDGKTPPPGFELIRDDRIVRVFTPDGEFPGLISGRFGIDENNFCPDNIAMEHGDLNKDDPTRPFFQEARNIATEQTRHEWCRLVNLVEFTYGDEGKNFLFDNWVQDRDTANRACIITLNR